MGPLSVAFRFVFPLGLALILYIRLSKVFEGGLEALTKATALTGIPVPVLTTTIVWATLLAIASMVTSIMGRVDLILFFTCSFALNMAVHPIRVALGSKPLEHYDVLIYYIALIASVVVAILALRGKTAMDLKLPEKMPTP